MTQLLSVKNLEISFTQSARTSRVVHKVSFDIARGEVVALVGESGSGKSVTALSTVSLLGKNSSVSGAVKFDGREMIGASEKALRQMRGNDISFIFQEPMTSLNPLHTL
ncbi:MAG: ATP-binding cassette domain-containing protein, partial [Rhodobacteraceae bacterium]|nr:ATP-binding cassette domain-containing protein [Paracoccaceae bacterium]